MADDYITYITRTRLAQIAAAEAQSVANLKQCEANADYENGAIEAQQLANCDAERTNLIARYNQHVASQTPPAPPELSPEEKAAKPWQRMDWSDALDLARTSRYGKTLDWNDPNMQAGYREVVQRRSRGE